VLNDTLKMINNQAGSIYPSHPNGFSTGNE
jgi:hypothetical protein